MTELDIHKLCNNPAVFSKARSMYKKHMVFIESTGTEEGITTVFAKVTGMYGEIFPVAIVLDENGIRGAKCNCHRIGEDLCKHEVAVLLEYVRPSEESGASVPDSGRTTVTMRAILDTYGEKYQPMAQSVQSRGRLTLEPVLRYDSAFGLQCEFKVRGETRGYIIKSLPEFIRAVQNGEYVQYGKEFGFLHTRDAFTALSQPLLSFLEQKVSSDNELYASMSRYSVKYDERVISLAARDLDEFFAIMEGETVAAYVGDSRAITLRRANPWLVLTIEGKGASGAALSLDRCLVMRGVRTCYVERNGVLYACEEAYASDMYEFLRHMTSAEDPDVMISRSDLPSFCANVLPAISRWVQIREKDISIEEFSPLPESFNFYLDMPQNNCITCRPTVSYGETELPLVASQTQYVQESVNRNLRAEKRAMLVLGAYFPRESVSDGLYTLTCDDELLYRFISDGVPELQSIGDVHVTDSLRRMKLRSQPKITIGVKVECDLLKLDIDCGTIPPEELKALLGSYKARRRFHRLKSGEFITLEENAIAIISELAEGLHLTGAQLRQGSVELPLNRAMYVNSVLKSGDGVYQRRDHSFRSLIRNMNSTGDAEFEVPEKIFPILRNYQKTGYRWMRTLEHYGFGGILADEMGLGKTVQVIAMLISEKERAAGTSLIVCPASLVYNWENELAKFAPELNVAVVAGSATERTAIIEQGMNYDVLVTSYDLLRRDIDWYEPLQFALCIIDEAQYIKNQQTLSARSVKRIHANTRFALTGTPIENRLGELWSIFDFLMPGFLGSYNSFRDEYEISIVREKDDFVRERLNAMISKFIMRRLKRDVLRELPSKLEETVITRMEKEQRALYNAAALELREGIEQTRDEDFGGERMKILAQLTRIRQICCDPQLCFEDYMGGSAKLETCMQLVRTAVEGGHKILLFSQFTSMLDIIDRRLEYEGISRYCITGSVSKERRMQLVNDFNHDDTSVFLISLKAGGTGLNLTSADIVIHYDPWWNLAAQNQATDRAHRIGQKNVVTVYKIIARDTIEERILEMQRSKQELAESVISDGGSIAALERDELISLLQTNSREETGDAE